MRIIMMAFALSFLLVACTEENGTFKEIPFTQVKEGDALAKENAVVAQALADMKQSSSADNSQLKTASVDFKNISLIAVRPEGSDWCGTMGCNTDFYHKQEDGSFVQVGGASSNLPLYALSCGNKNYIALTVPLEDRLAVWQISATDFTIVSDRLSKDSKTPCQDIK